MSLTWFTSFHWQDDWHEKHLNFHQKYPERLFYEGLQLATGLNPQHPYMPIYYGNVCLRLIPVLDILIHRLIEMTPGKSSFRLRSILRPCVVSPFRKFSPSNAPLFNVPMLKIVVCLECSFKSFRRHSSSIGKYPGYRRIVVQVSRKTGHLSVQHPTLLRQEIEEVKL